jgi:tRNA(Ile)-lysidine synthase
VTVSFAQAMADFQPHLPLAVAFSGGAESTALLVACAEKWPGQVHAAHIHHGLQAAADDFEAHCSVFCQGLGVPLVVKKVDARHASGQSPEDAARRARYKAFDALEHDEYASVAIKTIVLAQHADDQIETLILALSRGAGLPGLSAMPAKWVRGDMVYWRPLLSVRGADIRDWLKVRGIGFIEDPTNLDLRYTRNRIRAQVLPVLAANFPQFHETFSRSAVHAAQGQLLLTEVADQDLAQVGCPPVVKRLQSMSQPRQANLLRHWLRITYQVVPSKAQMTALQSQIAACTTRGHQIHLKVGVGFVRRQGSVLHWYNPSVSI